MNKTNTSEPSVLSGYVKQFEYYRSLGERAMAQISDEDLHWRLTNEDNSIAVIVKHLCGNMLSRWSDFMSSDGEKTWRERDAEFEVDEASLEVIMAWWNRGWDCLFSALAPLTDEELSMTVLIRNQEHTVQEAINRQLAHYSYHIGQIVLIAKMRAGSTWQALSIPRSESKAFNAKKFEQSEQGGHYTDE
ncbi:MAG: DUF1572 family protein [Flavobacteriales bacterium]|nr:DUF1572 family protein [Flavobacteriales bacterium]